MNRSAALALLFGALSTGLALPAEAERPNGGRGAGTVPIWNPHMSAPGNRPLTVRVLVLNYDPLVPDEKHRRLSEVFGWGKPAAMATQYIEAMEHASGGYLRFEVVEWRNLDEIYAKEDGYRPTVAEYVRNRRAGKGWGEHGNADYPKLLREQNVAPLVDTGLVDEVWIFGDHFFGLWEASMAGPGAFFINGGVYPQVPTRRPFAFYGFNYERGVAEMIHNTSHRTEATLNRVYGPWNLKEPRNNWEKFSANHDQSGGLAGVGTCHWPPNAKGDYDYDNKREVASWADAFLSYPKLKLERKPVTRDTWSRGPDYHLDYMKWYFAHVPRAAGVNEDGRQNNWNKYIFDFQSYDAKGKPRPAAAELHARDVADPAAPAHLLAVAYSSADHIDAAGLGDTNLTVSGPDGKPLSVKLVGGTTPGSRSYRVVGYRVEAPGGSWDKASPGEYAVALRTDQVRTTAGAALPGGRLGSFRVAGPGSPTELGTDADTTLLAHFDGSAKCKPGKPAVREKGLSYEPGVVGKGVAVVEKSGLSYPAAGVVSPKAGMIEFWVQPKWDGNAGKPHVLFQAGRAFDNCVLIQVDGANNLRLMAWGDDPATPAVERNVERGVGTSVAKWKAGEWHHLAATWSEQGGLALYVDGRLAEASEKKVAFSPLSTDEFWVGSGPDGSTPAAAVFDELRISNRVRTAGEIQAAAGAARGVETLTVEAPSGTLPPGGRGVVRATGRAKSGLAREVTREVAWTSSNPKVATVDDAGTVRFLLAGETTLTARLGGLTAAAAVKVTDPGRPAARLKSAANVARPGADPVTVVVIYDDPDGIRRESLGLGDVRVFGPNGFHQFPELLSAEPSGKGFTATYRVVPPSGKWREADRGVYTIEVKAFRVADTKGNHAPEGVLGEFSVLEAAKPK